MATVKIVSWSGATLWEGEAEDTRDALVKAVRIGANLSGAYLRGADLRGADLSGAYLSGANLSGAYLSGAYLSGAYLRGAYLSGANLRGANLSGAYLSSADLRGADLRGADLRSADLSGATGIDAYRTTPLLMLLDQPGPIRAYKLVKEDGLAPFNGGLTYEVGQDYEVANASTDVLEQCAPGIHVATLDWVLREWRPGWRILVAEFAAADIAAIPTCTDGKFRLRRCRIVAEKNLTEIGLVAAEKVGA